MLLWQISITCLFHQKHASAIASTLTPRPTQCHAAQGQNVHLTSDLTDVAIYRMTQILQLTSCGVSFGCSDWLLLVSV